MNALGKVTPDPAGTILGTGFKRFYSRSGIDGLARENGDRLDILAVVANKPGKGQFRSFIATCQKQYRTVCVWGIFNPLLEEILGRYGFTPETEIDQWGMPLVGMRWDRNTK